jgi:hypothetical protein
MFDRSKIAVQAREAVQFWGTTAAERGLSFACDRYLVEPQGVYFRGISVAAPPKVMFRWLCQLRIAPYSYDWLDNPGVLCRKAESAHADAWR